MICITAHHTTTGWPLHGAVAAADDHDDLGTGSEMILGVSGSAEDEVAYSTDEVKGMSNVTRSLSHPAYYQVGYSTKDKIFLSVFDFRPSAGP